jgi:predicted  nucleic acid-binding Zn-ribbon protein
MPTREERVACIEGQVSEHTHALTDVRDAVQSLERQVQSLEHQMDARFEAVDRRFDSVERRIHVLDEKVSRQFVWLVGLQVTTLAATVGALATIVGVLLPRA